MGCALKWYGVYMSVVGKYEIKVICNVWIVELYIKYNSNGFENV